MRLDDLVVVNRHRLGLAAHARHILGVGRIGERRDDLGIGQRRSAEMYLLLIVWHCC
jgi:hypothetical protein